MRVNKVGCLPSQPGVLPPLSREMHLPGGRVKQDSKVVAEKHRWCTSLITFLAAHPSPNITCVIPRAETGLMKSMQFQGWVQTFRKIFFRSVINAAPILQEMVSSEHPEALTTVLHQVVIVSTSYIMDLWKYETAIELTRKA